MINKIHNENCLDTMAKMPDEFVDLTVTSPPYDNLRTYNDNVDQTWNETVWKPIIKELYRVTKIGGVVVWVVADATINGSETGTSFRQALWAIECGFNLHDTMIYERSGVMPTTVRYCQQFEYMFVFSKGKPKTIDLIKDRKNNWGNTFTGNIGQRQKDGSIIKKGKKKINDLGTRFNIWRIINEGGFLLTDDLIVKHPDTFPEQLANDHIISWSNENDLVYDPFMGSGTTAKMALVNNRSFIGSEISNKYCDIANERIAVIQKKLV
jgi:site-specific DNA-methyltransferase (adenine-specific)